MKTRLRVQHFNNIHSYSEGRPKAKTSRQQKQITAKRINLAVRPSNSCVCQERIKATMLCSI